MTNPAHWLGRGCEPKKADLPFKMNFMAYASLVILVLLVGALACMECGRWLGARRLAHDPEAVKSGAGAVDAAVFALMGLLLAFAFSGAAARFDERRATIVEEANAIGTAWLRLDLLSTSAQPALRGKLRQYADARIAAFRKPHDLAAARNELAQADALQKEIWTQSVAACHGSGSSDASLLLLPALNQMFDVATTRTVRARTHQPMIIYVILGVLVFASALLAGYRLGGDKIHDWFHELAFIVTISLAVYITLDLEFPRMGLIRLTGTDQVMLDVRANMNP
jgi:hypothetical protein